MLTHDSYSGAIFALNQRGYWTDNLEFDAGGKDEGLYKRLGNLGLETELIKCDATHPPTAAPTAVPTALTQAPTTPDTSASVALRSQLALALASAFYLAVAVINVIADVAEKQVMWRQAGRHSTKRPSSFLSPHQR
jgi:hypothetical protein